MMGLRLLIELYLAAMLGVSGLAKLDRPDAFAATLRRHRILPGWSIPAVSRFVPWLEVALALLLLMGVWEGAVTAVASLLFLSFLLIETILVATKRATECGCFGVAYPQKVDQASLVVSLILLGLAAFVCWAAITQPPIHPIGRGLLLFVGGGAGYWLVWRLWRKRSAIGKTIF